VKIEAREEAGRIGKNTNEIFIGKNVNSICIYLLMLHLNGCL
jgi:hypothetical protein